MDTRTVALGGLLLLMSLSGCSVLMGESLVFEASPALVPNETATDSGYTLEQYNKTGVNETVDLGGMEREVRLSFHQVIYSEKRSSVMTDTANRTAESTYQNSPAAGETIGGTTISILSVPDAKLFGQSINPLVRLPTEQLITRFGQNADGNASNLDKQSQQEISMLDQETTLTTFNGTTNSDTGSKPASIAIAKTLHKDDVVIVIVVSPQQSFEDESDLAAFISDLEHPANPPN